MKALIIAAGLAAVSIHVSADTYVRGHVRSDGTYVAPHYRSDANSYRYDNYGAKGNTNPYTGRRGSGPSEFPSSPIRTYQPYQPYQSPNNFGYRSNHGR